MGVNICIAPQWCKCRCVCWVVSAHWVTTEKHNIHQLIHSESINTPQLILGVRGTSPIQPPVLSGPMALLPSKATSAAPDSSCPLTCLWGGIAQSVCFVEWGAHADVSQLWSFSALKRIFLGVFLNLWLACLRLFTEWWRRGDTSCCRTIYLSPNNALEVLKNNAKWAPSGIFVYLSCTVLANSFDFERVLATAFEFQPFSLCCLICTAIINFVTKVEKCVFLLTW